MYNNLKTTKDHLFKAKSTYTFVVRDLHKLKYASKRYYTEMLSIMLKRIISNLSYIESESYI